MLRRSVGGVFRLGRGVGVFGGRRLGFGRFGGVGGFGWGAGGVRMVGGVGGGGGVGSPRDGGVGGVESDGVTGLPKSRGVTEDAIRLSQLLRSRGVGDDASSRTVVLALFGNATITALKGAVYFRTGSSAMLAETIHTLVDTLNQAVLLLGVRESGKVPDSKHPFGYGKSAFFWSLVSALGLFWCGAGVSIAHGVSALLQGSEVVAGGWESWGVLGASLLIEGAVLRQATLAMLDRAKARDGALEKVLGDGDVAWWKKAWFGWTGVWREIGHSNDPFVPAVFLEDAVACGGVVLAMGGIGLTALTGDPTFDSIASIAIGITLAGVAIRLVQLNRKYLVGSSVEDKVVRDITELIRNRDAIDSVGEVQTQWLGPEAFSYKAEVDFDGTVLAAALQSEYRPLFINSPDLRADLPLLLSFFAEDVTRMVEREVKDIESEIRTKFPKAAFIELEPDSKDTDRRAAARMGDSAARVLERRDVAKALESVLLARRAMHPNDPDLEDEEQRLQRWKRRVEGRERAVRALKTLQGQRRKGVMSSPTHTTHSTSSTPTSTSTSQSTTNFSPTISSTQTSTTTPQTTSTTPLPPTSTSTSTSTTPPSPPPSTTSILQQEVEKKRKALRDAWVAIQQAKREG